MNNIVTKLTLAGTASVVMTEAVNPAPLLNALITLGVSIITVLSVEGIAWLKKFIKKHTPKSDEKEDKKDKEEK